MIDNEHFAAFVVVWKVAMADMIRAARHGDQESRIKFETMIHAMIAAYPDLADAALDPKARS